MNEQVPEEIWGTVVGIIDQGLSQRVIAGFTTALNNGIKKVHLLVHSTGGTVMDGIACYNFLRTIPLDLHTYNGGSVQSIGVVLFAAGKVRSASKSANFMIHRVAGNVVPPATAIKLKNLVDSVVADDARLEEIYKKEFKIPGEKIAALDYRDWFISAQEALDFGIVHNNDDFAPAVGAKMFNI